MSEACDPCLRRGYLIGLLAARIAGLFDRARAQPRPLLSLGDAELARAAGGDRVGTALAFLERFDPAESRRELRRMGIGAACDHSESYPDALRDLPDQPAVLFHRGRLELLSGVDEQPVVTVVGSRDATPYGLEVAHDLGRGLAAAGVTVVSGLALGIDGAVHRGALGGSGPAIAVLACGPERAYPRRHHDLHRRLCEQGLVISELPPGTGIFRWSFPARNRVMAALSRLTIVVEAAEGSGTLITTDFAEQLDRPIAAVPGPVTSRLAAGGNQLLRDGAIVIRNTQDVLDELFGAGARTPSPPPDLPALDPLRRKLLDGIEIGLDMDGVCAHAGVPAAEARAALARLEGDGLVRRDGLWGWVRVASG